MNKKCRIILYVLSIVMVTGCIAAVARTKGSTPEVKVPGEEPAAAVSGEDTEHEGADGGADCTPAREENETVVETTEAEERTEAAEVTEEAEAGGQAEADGSTTILFTGDVLFANAFKAGYDADGIKGVIAPELLEELQAADILMVNNEFPFSDRGTPMADKQFTFRCSPGYVKALNEMGVDVVSLANNHTLDYGREALSDTFVALDGAGILYGGAGDSAERAKQVQVIEVHGKKYGFIAVSRVVPTADWKVENAMTPRLLWRSLRKRGRPATMWRSIRTGAWSTRHIRRRTRHRLRRRASMPGRMWLWDRIPTVCRGSLISTGSRYSIALAILSSGRVSTGRRCLR